MLVTLAMLAFAQEQEPQPQNRRVRYKAETHIDFENVHVEADLVKPDGWWIPGDPPRHHDPLIKLRADFGDQMARSVDQLK